MIPTDTASLNKGYMYPIRMDTLCKTIDGIKTHSKALVGSFQVYAMECGNMTDFPLNKC